jgi:hypothetical protein
MRNWGETCISHRQLRWVGISTAVRWRIALRIQHLLNGGLRDRNPGLDLVGLNFVSRFGER